MKQRIVVRYKSFTGKVARSDRTRHKHLEESASVLHNDIMLDMVQGAMERVVGRQQMEARADITAFEVLREPVPFTTEGESLQVVIELDRSRCEELYESRDELREAVVTALLNWVSTQWVGDFEAILVDLRFVSSCGMSVRRDRRQVYTCWGGNSNPTPFTMLPVLSES